MQLTCQLDNGEGRHRPALQMNVGKDLESRGRQMNEEGLGSCEEFSLLSYLRGFDLLEREWSILGSLMRKITWALFTFLLIYY